MTNSSCASLIKDKRELIRIIIPSLSVDFSEFHMFSLGFVFDYRSCALWEFLFLTLTDRVQLPGCVE